MQRKTRITQRISDMSSASHKSSRIIAAAVLVVAGGSIAVAASGFSQKQVAPAAHRSQSHPEQLQKIEKPKDGESQNSARQPISESTVRTESKTSGSSNQNTSNSTSTVTINGSTTTLTGDGTIDKSYTTSDGNTDVSISIDHSTQADTRSYGRNMD